MGIYIQQQFMSKDAMNLKEIRKRYMREFGVKKEKGKMLLNYNLK